MKKATKKQKQEITELGEMMMANVIDYTTKTNVEIDEHYINECKRFIVNTTNAKTEQELVHEMKLFYILTKAMYPQTLNQ